MPAGKLYLFNKGSGQSSTVAIASKAKRSSYRKKTQQKAPQVVVPIKPKYISKVPRSAYGKGRVMVLKMPYTDTVDLEIPAVHGAGANYDEHVWNLNSINLPRLSPNPQAAGNYLPQNHNSVEHVFNRYKVLGAKVKVTFSDPTKALRAGVMLTTSSDTATFGTAGTTFVSQYEMKLGTSYLDLSIDGDKNRVYSRYIPIWQIEGLTKAQFKADIDRYSALITSNVATASNLEYNGTVNYPNLRRPKLHICISDPDAGTTVQSCNAKVDITYYVMMYEKKTIGVSQSV